MELCKEERLMEAVDTSAEARAFLAAAGKLAERIRTEASRFGYNLEAALPLVEGGNLTVAILDERGGMEGFTGLPASVGLYLTANACGGLFPQTPADSSCAEGTVNLTPAEAAEIEREGK